MMTKILAKTNKISFNKLNNQISKLRLTLNVEIRNTSTVYIELKARNGEIVHITPLIDSS